MGFRSIVATAAAVSLALTPTLAAVQTAPPPTAIAPAAEDVQGSELRGGWIIPLIALIAVILGLCIATDICSSDNDDLPTSP